MPLEQFRTAVINVTIYERLVHRAVRCDTLAHLNAGRSFDRGTYVYTCRECRTSNASNELLAFSVGPKKTVKGNTVARCAYNVKSAARECSAEFHACARVRPRFFSRFPPRFIRIPQRQFHIRPVCMHLFPLVLLGKYLANIPARRPRFSTVRGLTRRIEASALIG